METHTVPSLDNFPGFKMFSFDEFTLVARRVEILTYVK